MIYDRERQDAHAGGSGCGCSASVLCASLLPALGLPPDVDARAFLPRLRELEEDPSPDRAFRQGGG